jgi:hypothetical protein
VLVLLNREGFESSLPNTSRRSIGPLILANVTGEQPLHPAAQITVTIRPQDEVKMIWHQTVSQQTHRDSLTGAFHEPDEGAIVRVGVKYTLAAIASIDCVITDSPD